MASAKSADMVSTSLPARRPSVVRTDIKTVSVDTPNAPETADVDSFEVDSRPRERPLSAPTLPAESHSAPVDDEVLRIETSSLRDSFAMLDGGTLATLRSGDDAALMVALKARADGSGADSALAEAYTAVVASQFDKVQTAMFDTAPMRRWFLQLASAYVVKFGSAAPVSVSARDVEVLFFDQVMKNLMARAAGRATPHDEGVDLWMKQFLQSVPELLTARDRKVLAGYRLTPPDAPSTKTEPGTQTPKRGLAGRTTTPTAPTAPTAPQTLNDAVTSGAQRLPSMSYDINDALAVPDATRGRMLFEQAARRGAKLWSKDASSQDIDRAVTLYMKTNADADFHTHAPDFTRHVTDADLKQRAAELVAQGQAPMSTYFLQPSDLSALNTAWLASRSGYDDVASYQKELGTTLGSEFTEGSVGYLQSMRDLRVALGVDNAASRAVDEYGAELAKVGGNLLNLGEMLFYIKPKSFLQGYNGPIAPEDEVWMDRSMARVENSAQQFVASLPKDETGANWWIRNLAAGAVRIPQYAAFAACPPLATLYESGNHANDSIDQWAGAIAQDWLMIATGPLLEGPLGAVTKQAFSSVERYAVTAVGDAAYRRLAVNVAIRAAQKLTLATTSGTVNAATQLPIEVQAAMREPVKTADGTLRAPTNDEVVSRVKARFAENFSIGLGLAMLTPGQQKRDAALLADPRTITAQGAPVFRTIRDGKVELAVVSEVNGKREMLVVDEASKQGREVLQRNNNFTDITPQQMDIGLITSRMQHRFKPANVNAVMKEATRFADAKTTSDAAIVNANTKPAAPSTSTRTIKEVLPFAQRNFVDNAIGVDTVRKQEVGKLTVQEFRACFGDGPYPDTLARLFEFPGFGDYAKTHPREAALLLDAMQTHDVKATVLARAKNAAPTDARSAVFDGAVNDIRADQVTVQQNGAFREIERPINNAKNEPPIEWVLASPYDHNGAFSQNGTATFQGDATRVSTDTVTRFRPDLSQIVLPDGTSPTSMKGIATLGTHGSVTGLFGNNSALAKAIAERVVNRGDISALLVTSCDIGTPNQAGITQAQKFFGEVNLEIKRLGGNVVIDVFAANSSGKQYSQVRVDGSMTTTTSNGNPTKYTPATPRSRTPPQSVQPPAPMFYVRFKRADDDDKAPQP